MEDRSTFRLQHPDLCDPKAVRPLGNLSSSVNVGALVKDWREAMERVSISAIPPEVRSFKPTVRAVSPPIPSLRDYLGLGNEGAGHYATFRLEPENWGLHLSREALGVLAGELQRLTLRGFPEARQADLGALQEFVFRLAYDYALGHANFHASIDEVAAEEELLHSRPIYGPYLRGPYTDSLNKTGGGKFNLEEALANVVALRIFLTPGGLVELGSGVEKSLNQDDGFRWNSYLFSGVLAAEFIFLLRILPPGYKDFLMFLGKRTEITAYAHMGIQYNINQEEFSKGLQRLADQLTGNPGSLDGQKFLRAVHTPVYVY